MPPKRGAAAPPPKPGAKPAATPAAAATATSPTQAKKPAAGTGARGKPAAATKGKAPAASPAPAATAASPVMPPSDVSPAALDDPDHPVSAAALAAIARLSAPDGPGLSFSGQFGALQVAVEDERFEEAAARPLLELETPRDRDREEGAQVTVAAAAAELNAREEERRKAAQVQPTYVPTAAEEAELLVPFPDAVAQNDPSLRDVLSRYEASIIELFARYVAPVGDDPASTPRCRMTHPQLVIFAGEYSLAPAGASQSRRGSARNIRAVLEAQQAGKHVVYPLTRQELSDVFKEHAPPGADSLSFVQFGRALLSLAKRYHAHGSETNGATSDGSVAPDSTLASQVGAFFDDPLGLFTTDEPPPLPEHMRVPPLSPTPVKTEAIPVVVSPARSPPPPSLQLDMGQPPLLSSGSPAAVEQAKPASSTPSPAAEPAQPSDSTPLPAQVSDPTATSASPVVTVDAASAVPSLAPALAVATPAEPALTPAKAPGTASTLSVSTPADQPSSGRRARAAMAAAAEYASKAEAAAAVSEVAATPASPASPSPSPPSVAPAIGASPVPDAAVTAEPAPVTALPAASASLSPSPPSSPMKSQSKLTTPRPIGVTKPPIAPPPDPPSSSDLSPTTVAATAAATAAAVGSPTKAAAAEVKQQQSRIPQAAPTRATNAKGAPEDNVTAAATATSPVQTKSSRRKSAIPEEPSTSSPAPAVASPPSQQGKGQGQLKVSASRPELAQVAPPSRMQGSASSTRLTLPAPSAVPAPLSIAHLGACSPTSSSSAIASPLSPLINTRNIKSGAGRMTVGGGGASTGSQIQSRMSLPAQHAGHHIISKLQAQLEGKALVSLSHTDGNGIGSSGGGGKRNSVSLRSPYGSAVGATSAPPTASSNGSHRQPGAAGRMTFAAGGVGGGPNAAADKRCSSAVMLPMLGGKSAPASDSQQGSHMSHARQQAFQQASSKRGSKERGGSGKSKRPSEAPSSSSPSLRSQALRSSVSSKDLGSARHKRGSGAGMFDLPRVSEKPNSGATAASTSSVNAKREREKARKTVVKGSTQPAAPAAPAPAVAPAAPAVAASPSAAPSLRSSSPPALSPEELQLESEVQALTSKLSRQRELAAAAAAAEPLTPRRQAELDAAARQDSVVAALEKAVAAREAVKRAKRELNEMKSQKARIAELTAKLVAPDTPEPVLRKVDQSPQQKASSSATTASKSPATSSMASPIPIRAASRRTSVSVESVPSDYGYSDDEFD